MEVSISYAVVPMETCVPELSDLAQAVERVKDLDQTFFVFYIGVLH